MKKFLVFIGLFFLIAEANASNIPSPIENFNSTPPSYSLKYFSTLSIKEIQKLAGRKLKLKEKIAVKFFQQKLRKEIKREGGHRDKGAVAQTLGILGLATLFIPMVGLFLGIGLAIAALIVGYSAIREEPENKRAKTGIILGWITLALIAIATIIIIAVLTSFGISFGG